MTQNFLTQLTTLPALFPVNYYLVQEKDGLTLIDTGLSMSRTNILQNIATTGLPLHSIVLTHAHGDHIGSLKAVKDAHPDAQVYISARELELLKNPEPYAFEAQKPIKGSYPEKLPVNVDKVLQEGDMVGSLSVLETPGHTPGSISLFDNRSKIMIVGDTLQTRGGLAVAGDTRPLFPFPTMGTWDLETGIASAQKILQYRPSALAPGHGRILPDPLPSLEKVIERAKRKIR